MCYDDFMAEPVTRRDFLKIIGAALGLAATGGSAACAPTPAQETGVRVAESVVAPDAEPFVVSAFARSKDTFAAIAGADYLTVLKEADLDKSKLVLVQVPREMGPYLNLAIVGQTGPVEIPMLEVDSPKYGTVLVPAGAVSPQAIPQQLSILEAGNAEVVAFSKKQLVDTFFSQPVAEVEASTLVSRGYVRTLQGQRMALDSSFDGKVVVLAEARKAKGIAGNRELLVTVLDRAGTPLTEPVTVSAGIFSKDIMDGYLHPKLRHGVLSPLVGEGSALFALSESLGVDKLRQINSTLIAGQIYEGEGVKIKPLAVYTSAGEARILSAIEVNGRTENTMTSMTVRGGKWELGWVSSENSPLAGLRGYEAANALSTIEMKVASDVNAGVQGKFFVWRQGQGLVEVADYTTVGSRFSVAAIDRPALVEAISESSGTRLYPGNRSVGLAASETFRNFFNTRIGRVLGAGLNLVDMISAGINTFKWFDATTCKDAVDCFVSSVQSQMSATLESGGSDWQYGWAEIDQSALEQKIGRELLVPMRSDVLSVRSDAFGASSFAITLTPEQDVLVRTTRDGVSPKLVITGDEAADNPINECGAVHTAIVPTFCLAPGQTFPSIADLADRLEGQMSRSGRPDVPYLQIASSVPLDENGRYLEYNVRLVNLENESGERKTYCFVKKTPYQVAQTNEKTTG